jgi:amidase
MKAVISRRTALATLGKAVSMMGTAALASWPAQARPRTADELIDYDALGLALLIRKGELKPEELIDIVERRIGALDPVINCITTLTLDRARKRATKIDKNSLFAGVPILIKDMIDVGGVRRTDGSRMQLTNVPAKNVAYIDGVESAGLNIIGMTNVPEFAQMGVVTNNTAFGLSRNPWDLTKSTLGSSGGAAAAVASGILPLVHGTDGGGSNRLPASACGIFGMKPSYGRMLVGEADGKHGPFKTNQAMSRTVRDSAALFSATEDKSGKLHKPVGLITGPSTKRLRIGYCIDASGGMKTEATVAKAQMAVVELLKSLGHKVRKVPFPIKPDEFFKHYNGAFLSQFGPLAQSARALTGRNPVESGLLDHFTSTMMEYGQSFTAEQQKEGLKYLATVPARYAAAFNNIDILMSPVMPVVSIPADALRPTDRVNASIVGFMQDRMQFTAATNVARVPAMSVPLSWDDQSGLELSAKVGDGVNR